MKSAAAVRRDSRRHHPGRIIGGSVGGCAVLIFTMSAGMAVGQSNTAEADHAVAATLTTPPPVVITNTKTVTAAPKTVTQQAALPSACTDYANELDRMAKTVYAYQATVAPVNDNLQFGLQALIDGSGSEIQTARSKQQRTMSDVNGALADLEGEASAVKNEAVKCKAAIATEGAS